VPPSERPIPRFVAEPPREGLPYGRWAETLGGHFLSACERIEGGDDMGEVVGEVGWFPERTFSGRTYVPAAAPTSRGLEVFGFVSFRRLEEGEPADFEAHADFTDETAEANPDWELDLSDRELGPWHGPEGRRGDMTLIWGVALVPNGAVATAELGPTTTDQCVLVDERFTLVSLDNYTGDYLEVKLFGVRGVELAAESLYEEG
jgi:hypothetical protein